MTLISEAARRERASHERRNRAPASIVEQLQIRALTCPDLRIFTFLERGEREAGSLSLAELDCRARFLAAKLLERSLEGKPLLLLYRPGLDFILAFLACLIARAIPVPVSAPQPNRPMPRFDALLEDAGVAAVLTTENFQQNLLSRPEAHPRMKRLLWLATDRMVFHEVPLPTFPEVRGSDLAYLQYTSGSTSRPKGVRVTHGNLLANLAELEEALDLRADSVIASWLPHFHDMGLVFGILLPLYSGIPTILMAPIAFIQKPIRWLQTLTRYRVTHGGGPNFAFDLCVSRTDAARRKGLDLRSWRAAFNGSEPIRVETFQRFCTTFAAYGFKETAFCPAYGLAEATLLVTVNKPGKAAKFPRLRARDLEEGRVREASDPNEPSRCLAGCGSLFGATRVRIVDPVTRQLREPGEIGEIWVSGPSVAGGYWRKPEASERDFTARIDESGEGPFLRTGDLGCWFRGELLITGRLKDLIIVAGRNYDPADIELTASGCHPALQASSCVAFSVEGEQGERVVLMAEVVRSYKPEQDASGLEKGTGARSGRILVPASLIKTIRSAVSEHHQLPLNAVVLLKSGALPKTTSGKIQRHLCRQAFLDGNTLKPWS